MSKGYQIASKKDSRQLRQFLAQHGQALQPMVELIEQGRLAVEELVGQLGRAALEAVLLVSAEQMAGPPHPGRPGSAGNWGKLGAKLGTGNWTVGLLKNTGNAPPAPLCRA